MFGLIKGKLKGLVYAHDTSRVIENLLTYARAELRKAIFEELTPEIIRMSKSVYAHFLVIKMLRHWYASLALFTSFSPPSDF